MKWQGIDAAPKDGTPVLLYFPGASMRIGCWKDRGAFGMGWRDPLGHAEEATILGEPSHWMRLPDPPQQQGGPGRPSSTAQERAKQRNRSAMAV